MNLLSRIFILVSIVFFTIFLNVSAVHSVLIVLIGTTLSSLSYYYAGNNKFSILYLFIIVCLVNYHLDFLWLALLLIYDFKSYKIKYLIMIVLFFVILAIDSSLENKMLYTFWILLIYFLVYLNDLYLKTKKTKEALEIKNLLALDRLNKQNKALLESQDQQINYAKLNERGRIARDIHDSVGHLLSSSILQLGAIKTINQDQNLEDAIDNLDSSLNKAMDDIRNSVFQIHSSSINLPDAINEIIILYPDYTFDFYYDINNEMSSKLKMTFLYIIKETINNTIKHSTAKKIKVIIRELTNHYQLIIHDDGKSSEHQFQNGIGLTSIEERVAVYKGVLTINTSDGFKIFISINKEDEECA